MNSKLTGIIVVAFILIALTGLYTFTNSESNSSKKDSNFHNNDVHVNSEPLPSHPSQNVDFTARFSIQTNGIDRVFTSSMYHNQSSDVYIQSSNPNTIHVTESGVTWNDFFSTLPFELSEDCLTTGDGEVYCTGQSGKLQFYLNGNSSENVLERVIEPNDHLVVTFGN